MFLSTEIVKPFCARALFSCKILSVVVHSKSEKPLILTPLIFGLLISFPSEKIILFSNPKEYFSTVEESIISPVFSIVYSLVTIFLSEVYFHSSSLVVGNPFDMKEVKSSFFSSEIFTPSEYDFKFSIKPTFCLLI